MTTLRTVTLSEMEGAPNVTALCDDAGWNGFHVPLLTAGQLETHYRALEVNDPNGMWDELHAQYVGPEESGTEFGVIVAWSDESSDSWECINASKAAWIDGLAWCAALDENGNAIRA